MANPFDVFKSNPKKMPGQGLASPDFDYQGQSLQYQSLLDQYQRGLDSHSQGLATGNLRTLQTILNGTGDQAGASKLYLDAIRNADPENARLMDTLTGQATSDLALDNRLDPSQIRMVEQSSRAGAADRGLGYGPNDLFAEQFAKLGYGDQLRDKRRNAALTLQQLRQSLAMKPADIAIQTQLSQSPEQNMWNTLNNTYAQNAENSRTQASLETKIGMDQAEKWNGWFKVAAGAACWAAREVFGTTDARWLHFRHWLLTEAPEKLRSWYLANGERWAERLHNNPVAKAVVKRWMERRIHV